MKIKLQYIGRDINATNLADQAVKHLGGLACWNLYASGKASIGRKASLQAIRKLLYKAGYTENMADQFLSDVIERLRLEQMATVPSLKRP